MSIVTRGLGKPEALLVAAGLGRVTIAEQSTASAAMGGVPIQRGRTDRKEAPISIHGTASFEQQKRGLYGAARVKRVALMSSAEFVEQTSSRAAGTGAFVDVELEMISLLLAA